MQRRSFLRIVAATPSALVRPQPSQSYDLLIRNGTVFDPARGFHKKADVAIAGDRIAAIEESIAPDRAKETIDAAGLLVAPGIVDLHTHCYWGATGLGVQADPIAARSGCTTWVDAGSFGWNQVEGFRHFIVEPAKARIFGFVYLYPDNRNPDVDPVRYVRSGMRRTGDAVLANRDILIGVKFQVGSNMNGRYSLEFLKIARELCDTFKLRLMAHISFAPPETDEVMALMRPGDIVTHCFNSHTLGILDAAGKIRGSVLVARTRGVLFDVGHGLGSFNFEAARKALDLGFLPDTVSSDIYNQNVNGPVYDMPTTMSKLLYLGMSLEDVVARSTAAPARIVDRVPGLGSLTPGGPADVALLAIEEGEHRLVDSQKNVVTARRRITGRGAICRGKRLPLAASAKLGWIAMLFA